MGYITKYHLKIDGDRTRFNSIMDLVALRMKFVLPRDLSELHGFINIPEEYNQIRNIEILDYLPRLLDATSMEWYSWENDLRRISKVFPELLFELSGEGARAHDLWKAYFRDGKFQFCQANINYPKFDDKELK